MTSSTPDQNVAAWRIEWNNYEDHESGTGKSSNQICHEKSVQSLDQLAGLIRGLMQESIN